MVQKKNAKNEEIIFEENNENDEEHNDENDEENDENYDYIKFNSAYNIYTKCFMFIFYSNLGYFLAWSTDDQFSLLVISKP